MKGVFESIQRDLGAGYQDIVYFSKPMVSRHGFLTANNNVPYVIVVLNTKGGPVVLDVPAKQFWSFVLYSSQSRSMLQTDQQFPSTGSLKKGIVVNADSSVDVYFGPKAPAGKENNWVQTMPGKGWNVILRLYSPLKPWYDKTWRPSEIELVK